ncbi:TetR/AcrR family transcriptional regulator [Pseudomonas aeruginosa]|nr:TetR/AcrR family transcriptional regulator [Pseudomonas aeruginosa]
MRYKPEQKQATRALLLSKAAPLVKRQGFASTGLDTLMKAAGLTTGAFYSQFSSKAELLEAILQRELSAQHDAFPLDSLEQLAGAIRLYLRRGHAQHADMGCPIPALAAEVGRAGPEVRETFERALEQRQRRLAELMGDETRAWGLTCLAVGAGLLARAQASDVARDKVLDAALEHALGLLSASGAASPQADRD